MVESFLKFVTSEKLFSADDKLLLAVSGGIDSMVMSQLFLNAGISFGIAHVNYNLRGKDSLSDRDFVKEWAEEHGLTAHVKEVSPKAYESKESVQMVARHLRYSFFSDLMSDYGYTRVATAHHLNDSFETILLNLIKGTGPSGLKGIPITNGYIIRPLMFAKREEICEYAHAYNIKWREDASNSRTEYQRNFIRHEISEKLKKINPALMDTFRDTQVRLAATADLVQETKLKVVNQNLIEKEQFTELALGWMNGTSSDLLILSEILRDYGLNFSQCKDVFTCIREEQIGKIFKSDDHVVNVDRNRLIIKLLKEQEEAVCEMTDRKGSVEVNGHFFSWCEARGTEGIDTNPDMAYLDADDLDWPLRIRPWHKGDTFVPLGMTGKKRISDFMIDNKIPLSLKEDVLVIQSGEDIVWVVGMRISDRYKIKTSTKRVLKISVNHAQVF